MARTQPLKNPRVATLEAEAGEEVRRAAERAANVRKGKKAAQDRAAAAQKVELEALLVRMRAVAEQTYWTFFWSGMGAEVHAFIEFNGLISKYIDLCSKAAEAGVDFRVTNTHTKVALPVEGHDLEYLAEKLRCIFGPTLDADPVLKHKFLRALAGSPGTDG